MSSVSLPSSQNENRGQTLDDALEVVLLALESDAPLDRELLVDQFPQWSAELNQFIDNWLTMEHKTAQLAETQPMSFHIPDEQINGKVVGDYELVELIKAGGMGVVYRARQVSLGRIVALKMVLNTVRDKTRFRIEAEAAASLHHANIVTIHEVGEFEGQPFLSMQYIAGGNLQDHLQAGPMAPRAAASLVRTIAQAVHYAHQRGILHRDLKPANVLLDTDRKPYVSDFGLAKQIGNSVELTRSGAIIGTPGYMAPEQAMGQVKSITVAADVYGLGAILYATLTGEPPFKSDSDLLTLRKVIEEPPTSPRTKRNSIDRNLETICLKCLEKAPAARYGSARQLADDLTRYLRGEPVQARPIGFVERRWRWCVRNPALATISFFAGLMVAAVVLITLGFIWRETMARMNDRIASIREAAMTEAIGLAQIEAASKNQVAQQAIADLYTNNGLWAARTNLHGEAIMWFAKAAQLSDVTPEYVIENKTRCLSWLAECPKPVAAYQLTSPIQTTGFPRDWNSWQVSRNLSELMFKSGDDFGIWHLGSNEIWRPIGGELPISAGAWSQDGKSLAIGSTSGELRLIDAKTKATHATVFLDEPILCLAFAHTSKSLAVCTPTRLMLLSSTLSSQGQHSLETQSISVKFAANDGKLAVVTSDSKVTAFDVSQPEPKRLLQVPCVVSRPHSLTSAMVVDFSEDGAKLFVRTEERGMRIFDVSTGQQLGKPIVTGSTHSIALASDQRHCICGGDAYARVQAITWTDSVPKYERHNSLLAHTDAVTNVAFGGQNLIATAGRDRVVQLWNIGEVKPSGVLLNERATPLATLTHTDEIIGMLFPDKGDRLVTVQRDGLVRVWKIPKFEPPGYAAHGTRGGTTVKSLGNDRWFIAGSTYWGSNVVNASLRRLKDGVVIAETPLHGVRERGHLLDTAIAAEHGKLISLHANRARSGGTMLAQENTAGSLQVWDFPECRPFGEKIGLRAEPRSVVMHPHQALAAVLLVNMDILLIDVTKAEVLATLTSQQASRSQPLDRETGIQPSHLYNGQLQFTPDGELLVAWGIGKGFSVWDWQQRQPAFSTAFADEWSVRNLAISPSGHRLALSVDESNRVVVINSSDGEIVRSYDHAKRIRSVKYSPTGKELLTAGDDGRARIIELVEGSDEYTDGLDLVHNKRVLDAVYSGDGTSIATLTSEMRVYLWRVRDRQWSHHPLRVPPGTQRLLYPDSQHIVTMGSGNLNRVLDISLFDGTNALDPGHATRLGELLAAKSIGNGGIASLTSDQWLKRWQQHSEFERGDYSNETPSPPAARRY